MNVNHFCESLNSIQAARDNGEISHDNYLQAIAEVSYWYYSQADEEQENGISPRIVFSDYDSKSEPPSIPQPVAYLSRRAPEDLAAQPADGENLSRVEADTARTQLAKAVGLLQGFLDHLNEVQLMYWLNRSRAFLARHVQTEQQEAKPVAVESQSAQAGDERAAFERKVQDLAERFQPDYRRYGDAGEYKDATLEWAWKLWQARAALATQPAAGEPVAHKLVAVQANGEWQEVRGKWKDGAPIAEMLEGVEEGYLRVELAFSAPPAAAHGDELESIGEMCRMLEEGEFAEHAGKGPTADRVESCIVKLLGEVSEAQERAEAAEARLKDWRPDDHLASRAAQAMAAAQAELPAGYESAELGELIPLLESVAGTTSDQYRADMYDEVLTTAKAIGYASVGAALNALANRLTNERAGPKPVAAIDASGDVITERDCVSAEVFATCCKTATPLFYAFAHGVPVYQIRHHDTNVWQTVGPNSYDAAANCPDVARRVAYLPLAQAYS